MEEKRKIISYQDLDVYQNTYEAMLIVHQKLLTRLPQSEKYDLVSQISRASKSIPRLIAEGYAKRHQKLGFCKYLDDAMAESNELVVSLSQCRDLYNINCSDLIDLYDKSGKQLYRLSFAWRNMRKRNM